MAATYDPNLPTDRDWVRFLVGDIDTATAELDDGEIDALLVEEANKYLAAARALSGLHSRWGSAGKGVLEKEVGNLRIEYGGTLSADAAITARISELRRKGAWQASVKPRLFASVRQ